MDISSIVKLIMSLFTYHTGRLEESSEKQPSKSPASEPGVKVVDGYYIWNKREFFKLDKYFNTEEFQCQCTHESCVEQRISAELVDKLYAIREELGRPLKVTSGFRCEKHQADLRKAAVNTVVAKKSTHELGDAADIRPADRNMEGFEELCDPWFFSIGIAKTFLHVDLRDDKERRWNY